MTYLKNFLLLVCLIISGIVAKAELVYSNPAILQQNSDNVVIYFNAAEGTGGLKGETSGIYAHTGVITDKSSSDSDWKYAPSKWGDNSEKYKLTNVGTDLWKLDIGKINTFYGIASGETVKKLCFVFRNADCTKEGKGSGGSDIFIEVHPDGLSMSFSSSVSGNVITDADSRVTFTANTTQNVNLSLYINDTNSTPIAQKNNTTRLSASYDFAIGDYYVIARAEGDGKVLLDTISVCHRSESKAVTYSGTLQQGAIKNADGSVTFCIYAPGKSNVILVGEWDNYRVRNANVMNYQDNKYFWTTIPAGVLDMDKEYGYYFIVDDNITVADPYARLILDPWNDKYINQGYTRYPNLKTFPADKVGTFAIAVFHGNGDGYKWKTTNFQAPDKNNLMIYEMLLRDFTSEQCIETAMAKLDYLKELGINAIELMPIQEFDGNNSWGYNPNFYFAPDKYYGCSTAYKLFIDECHKRGIAVILDVVFNHAWGQHPWCKMYWNGNKPSADNPFFNVDAPHNWSVGNDWKMESPAVQSYFCDVLKYWLTEYKVDGYRFDLAKGLGDSNSYKNNYDAGGYNASRIQNIKRFINAIKDANPNAYCIFEYFVDKSEENEIANAGGMSWKKMTSQYAQSAMGYSSNSSFSGMYSGDESRPFGSIVSYMESHDEERTAYSQKTSGTSLAKITLYGMRRLGSNAAFTILVPGPKMIWQFGEMGYDISGGNGDTDPKAPHWEYLDNEYRKGLHDSYKEQLSIRNNNPELFSSNAEFYWSVGTSNWDSGRFITARNKSVGKELVAAYNPTASQKTFSYTFDNPGGKYYIASKTYKVEPSFDSKSGTITIPAHSYVVVTNFDNSGVDDNIIDETTASKVSIYHNPATESVNVITSSDVKSIEIYSVTGQQVARNVGEQSIDVSNLANGNYIVRISTTEGVSVEKLIKN